MRKRFVSKSAYLVPLVLAVVCLALFCVVWLCATGPFLRMASDEHKRMLFSDSRAEDTSVTKKSPFEETQTTPDEGQSDSDPAASDPVAPDTPDSNAPDAENAVCPVALPQPHGFVRYQRGVTIETWTAQAQASCQEYARALLYSLYDAGVTLVEAGYLDLFGNNWGCVLQSETEGSIIVTLRAQQSRASDTLDTANATLLDITVIRILPLEMVL